MKTKKKWKKKKKWKWKRKDNLTSRPTTIWGSIVLEWTAWAFYWSKYWEWLDTAFLILSDREISWLQYTHHMSTALLTYVNINPFISSIALVTIFTNTLVHTFMYWYFAFSKGVLRPYRRLITVSQTVQHFFVLLSLVYIIGYHQVNELHKERKRAQKREKWTKINKLSIIFLDPFIPYMHIFIHLLIYLLTIWLIDWSIDWLIDCVALSIIRFSIYLTI